jgi:ribosomal protein L3 glutamine methyltransferase
MTPQQDHSRFTQNESTAAQLSTILDYIRYAVSEFNQHDVYYGHGSSNAWQEAHYLVLSALSLPLDTSEADTAKLYPCSLTVEERTLIIEWIQVRCEQGLPLAYITGQAWFAGMPFYVDERVLVPRSPFAELIDKRFSPYLHGSKTAADKAPQSILDMCTGGGCIAIALAHTFEEAVVDAVDIDSDALDVAAINIAQYQLEERVFPIQSDLFTNLSGQKYDLIVVNPPYVDAEDMADLPREYHHEPELALASGEDGLDLSVQILQQASTYMSDDAWLFIEVGNSEVNTAQRFGNLPIKWCELNQGGSGIFAIHKSQLDAHTQQIENLE